MGYENKQGYENRAAPPCQNSWKFWIILKDSEKNPKHLKSSAAVSTILGLFEHSKRSKKTQHSKKNKAFKKSRKFKKRQHNRFQKIQKINKTATKKKRNGMVWNVLEFYLMMGYNPITPLWVSLCMRAPILREENSYERSSTNGLIGTALQLEE